jgi:F420-non-reducing hydrogenase iron-sulfur subunit
VSGISPKSTGVSKSKDEPKKTDQFEPRILAFCCNWCSYAGADLAGTSRMQMPPNVRIIRVNCTGRIDISFILDALHQGADGVLVSGCHPGDCHYTSGNLKMEARFVLLKSLLTQAGIEPERVHLQWASAAEGDVFSEGVTMMVERIKLLGPNPVRRGT